MPGLGTIFSIGAPIGSALLSTARSHYANRYNRANQQAALEYNDQQAGGLQDQYQGLVNQQLSTNQNVLYGGDVPKGMQPNPTQLQGYRGLYDATTAQGQDYYNQLTGAYGNRLNQGMAMLQGYGNAAREDLNRQYSNLSTQVDSGLRDRGFAGSMLASGAIGVQNQKDRSTRALNEQLQGQALNLYSGLSSDYLNAIGQGQANLLNLGSGLAQQFIGAQQGVQQQSNQAQLSALGYADANLNRRLGIMQGYPAQGPPPGNIFDAAQSGFNNYMSHQVAQEANSGKNDWLAPTLTGGLLNYGIATDYALASGM